MSKIRFAGVVPAAMLAAVGCLTMPGGGDKGSSSSSNNQQQQQQQQQSQNPLQALEQMGKALGGGQGDQKPVPAIDYHKLKDALPSVSGWTQSDARGEMGNLGQWTHSEASASYDMGEAHVTVKISDFAYVQTLMAPFMMMFTMNFSSESDDGYEKSVTIGGNPAHEKWNKNDKSGELTIWVQKRLIVEVEGRNIPDTTILQTFANAIDYGKMGPLS